jgi:hypothetical protein
MISNDLRTVKQKYFMLFSSVNSLHFSITTTVTMLKFYRITPLLQVDLLLIITHTSGLLLIFIIRNFTFQLLFFFLLSFCILWSSRHSSASKLCVCVCVCVLGGQNKITKNISIYHLSENYKG